MLNCSAASSLSVNPAMRLYCLKNRQRAVELADRTAGKTALDYPVMGQNLTLISKTSPSFANRNHRSKS